MELQQYLEILRRRKWIILTTIFVTEIIVIIGTFLATPIYSASATLRIATASTGTVNYSDYMYADRLLNTYTDIATSRPVLDELKQQLGLEDLPLIEVKPLPETELIQITVEHPMPSLAASIANTLAEILIDQSTELYTGSGESSLDILSEQLTRLEDEVDQAREEYMDLVARNPDDAGNIQAAKQEMDLKQEIYGTTLELYEQTRLKEAIRAKSISMVESAVSPLSPIKPRKALNIGLGFLISLVGGFGFVVLFENLDTTLHTEEQIENLTKLPNLGLVPSIGVKNQFKSPYGSNPYSESFAQLRTNILRLNKDKALSTLLITSAEQGDGKSTIVSNLAFALAHARKKVIVVDCDLRVPNQHKIFNIPNRTGLSNVLMEEANLEDVIQATQIAGLYVLTSGPVPRYSSELLSSTEMNDVIDELRKSFDMIIIDTPAFIEVTDAAVLAPQMDGVIVIVGRGSSHKVSVRAVCKQLENNKANTIGFVINHAKQNSRYYYHQKKKTSLLDKLSIF